MVLCRGCAGEVRQKHFAYQQGLAIHIKNRAAAPSLLVSQQRFWQVGIMSANQAQGNGAALQLWLAKQKCAQRPIALFAQVTQTPGEAGQWQYAAGKYPILPMAHQYYFAHQTALVQPDAQGAGLAATGALRQLTQNPDCKMAMAEMD